MNVILITMALQSVAPYTRLTSENERLRAYITSILKWLSDDAIDAVVVCNNSGSFPLKKELIQLAEHLDKKFEFVEFEGNTEKIKQKGKGYGEGEIIKFALENSLTLNYVDHFFKVTGKLYVSNFINLINKMNYSLNYCHLSAIKLKKRKMVDTRFYFVQKKLYEKYFKNAYKLVEDIKGIYLEHIFYKIILKNNLNFYRFPIRPYIEGVSGSTAVKYAEDKNIKYFIKNFLYRAGFYSI